MKQHPILRALPLFRPLIKNVERLEKEREKLDRKIQRLTTTVAERDARLQALALSLTEVGPVAHEEESVPFAEVKVAAGDFEKPRFEKFPYAGPFPWLDCADADAQIEAKLAAGAIGEYEAEQFRCWKENGYLILERAIEPELLDEVWAAYDKAIADGVVELQPEKIGPDDPWPGRYQDPHMKVPAICRVMRHPKLLHWVRLLMEHEPAPFQTIASHKGSQQKEHSDSIHMTTYPIGYLTASWVAFEDIHPDSGPLVYYPGSHRLPYVLSKDVGIGENDYRETGFTAYYEKYEPRIQELLKEHGMKPHYFHAKKGDVLFWHANLIHGGSPRRDLRLSRHALVSHYFVKGAVCYHDFSASHPKEFSSTCLLDQQA
ncbi:MAG: phytanoyl-CoA dioxygenase family protein [Chthoniobacterales bacterium]